MKKASIYTRSGDEGTTGLVSGARTKKNNVRIDLYGDVDELNSFLGQAIAFMDKESDKGFLHLIQSALFDLGCNLACEKDKRSQFKLPQLKEELILKMEKEIDRMDAELPSLSSFILPGGTLAAASFHVCRTICRRVERKMVNFEEHSPGEVPQNGLAFMNRLSDFFFTMSRYVNFKSCRNEINWVPQT